MNHDQLPCRQSVKDYNTIIGSLLTIPRFCLFTGRPAMARGPRKLVICYGCVIFASALSVLLHIWMQEYTDIIVFLALEILFAVALFLTEDVSGPSSLNGTNGLHRFNARTRGALYPFSSIATFLFSVFFWHYLVVMFGAPFFERVYSTLQYATLMSILTVMPAVFRVGGSPRAVLSYLSDSEAKISLGLSKAVPLLSRGSIVGSFLASFLIPLDWDQPYQEFPFPCAIGAILGHRMVLLTCLLSEVFGLGDKIRNKTKLFFDVPPTTVVISHDKSC